MPKKDKAKKHATVIEAVPEVLAAPEIPKVSEHVCSECAQPFELTLDDKSHHDVNRKRPQHVPLRVCCPHCGERPVVAGEGACATAIKRKDWKDEFKPWENHKPEVVDPFNEDGTLKG